ncbi:MAG: ASPIC/UnbV domain-containing protein [Isosphaeraceae bacterium]
MNRHKEFCGHCRLPELPFFCFSLFGKTSNRDAIGAKVEIKLGGQTCRRQLFPAKSYLSSIEFPLTFGLGNAQKVDELTIT